VFEYHARKEVSKEEERLMAFNIFDEIQKRSKSQWIGLVREQVFRGRTWIQENGEASFLIGIVLGLSVVVFAKPVLIIVALVALVGVSFYMLAPEQAPEISQGEGVSSNRDKGAGEGESSEHPAADEPSSPEETKLH
jgi:hypothetical protein